MQQAANAATVPVKNDAAVAGDCPFCGGAESSVRQSGAGYSIVECRGCRGARTFPTAFVSSSDYANAPTYANAYLDREPQFRAYARRIVRQVRRYAATSGRWLDVGSSVGILVDEARKAGFESRGIDLDPAAIKIGQSLGFNVSVLDLREIPDGSFDLLTLSHCLEHIQQPASFLRLCREKLAGGGAIFIVVPCHDSYLARAFNSRWYGWQPAQHYFHYSKASLGRLLTSAGFFVEHIHQESMDHKPAMRSFLSPKQCVKNILTFGLVGAGNLFSRGDQLVGIARKAP